MGTGDGLFVYNRARLDPRTFFIGLDANRRPLQKLSEKIYRKPAKGGLSNVLFLQASVEALPTELEGLADEVYVNFPWGSLLAAVLGVNQAGLINLGRLILNDGRLKVTVGFDSARDNAEWERLQLPALSQEYLITSLISHYESVGLEIMECDVSALNDATLETSWARRLSENKNRSVIRLVARSLKITAK